MPFYIHTTFAICILSIAKITIYFYSTNFERFSTLDPGIYLMAEYWDRNSYCILSNFIKLIPKSLISEKQYAPKLTNRAPRRTALNSPSREDQEVSRLNYFRITFLPLMIYMPLERPLISLPTFIPWRL